KTDFVTKLKSKAYFFRPRSKGMNLQGCFFGEEFKDYQLIEMEVKSESLPFALTKWLRMENLSDDDRLYSLLSFDESQLVFSRRASWQSDLYFTPPLTWTLPDSIKLYYNYD